MGRTLVFTRPSARALSRMPPATEGLIRAKLRQLAEEPEAMANNVKALKGQDGFRLRVGDWRVIFTREADRVIVHAVGPRGSIYD